MALTRTVYTQGSVAGGTSVATTPSFTPPNSSLLVVVGSFVDTENFVTGGGGGSDLSVSDSIDGTTGWTSRAVTPDPAEWGMGMHIWTKPITTGAAMTVSVTSAAGNFRIYVQPIAYEGYDTSTPVGGTVTAVDSSGDGAKTITLSSAPAAASEVLGVLTAVPASGTLTVTHGTGWTELWDIAVANWTNFQGQVRTGSTSDSVVWDDMAATGTGLESVLAAIEIRAADEGGGSTYTLTAEGGSYTVSSSAVYGDYVMVAEPGAYSITGIDANLAYAGAVIHYTITAEQGIYNITGRSATLDHSGLSEGASALLNKLGLQKLGIGL
jgi:hypothetical protein